MHRLKKLLVAFSLSALAATSQVSADDKSLYTVRPQLDPLPASLDGIIVELRQTAYPQIVIFNLTNDPLAILDEQGRAFLTVGPQDVKADYATRDFHLSRYAEEQPLPNNAHGPPRWYQINEAPTWGWFDTRLRVPKPAASATAGEIGRWRIPVQLGDQLASINGRFVYQPAPGGIYRSVIDNQDMGLENTSAHALVGHRPGVYLHSRGNDKFNIVGPGNENFLRFLPSKVLVNRSSAAWSEAAPADAIVPPTPKPGGAESWAIVSTTAGFGWHDPRVQYNGKAPTGDAPRTVKTWKIPLETAQGTRYVEGHTEWIP